MNKPHKQTQEHPNALSLIYTYIISVGDKSRETLAVELGVSRETLLRLSKKKAGGGYTILTSEERSIVEKVLRGIIKEGYATLKSIQGT